MLNTKTPYPIIEKMIEELDVNDEHSVLEPSAGEGDIVERLKEKNINNIKTFELNKDNRNILKNKNIEILGHDFLKVSNLEQRKLFLSFDRIIMVPPYKDFADIEHIRCAYELYLRDKDSILVSLTLPVWINSNHSKANEFKNFLSKVNHKLIILDQNVYEEGIFSMPYVLLKIQND